MCEKHFYTHDSPQGVEKFTESKLCSHAAHGKTCTVTEEYRHPHNETPAPAHSTSRVTPSPPLSEASLAGYTGSDRSYQYINGTRVFVGHRRSPIHRHATLGVRNESNVTLTRRQGTVRPRSENPPPRFTTQHVRYPRRPISVPTTDIRQPHFGGQEAEDKTLREKARERIRPSEIDSSFYTTRVLNYTQDLDKDIKCGTYGENNFQKSPPKYLVQKGASEAKPDLAASDTNDKRLTRQILPTHETFPRDEDQKDSPESDGDSSSETSQQSAPESLFSIVSTLSSRTNQSLSQEQQGGTELLIDFLFNHPELNQLYKITRKKADVTELQQHLRHFFRYYGQNLKKEASNYQERRASGFVYFFAGHVAKKVSRAIVGQLSSRPNKLNRRNVDTWLKDPGSKYASGTDDPDDSDDSDDPDDLSQEYPLLDSVKQFMESSAAFQVLKHDLRDWVRLGDPRDNQAENSQQEDLEVQTPEPGWTITENRLLRTLPEVLDSFLSILHPFLPELAIPLGKTRIRWACSCGQQFYDDFIELEDGALGLLQQSLQENGKTKRNFGYIPSSLQVFLPAFEGLLADLRQRFRHAVTRIGKYCPLRFGDTLPSHSGHNPALQSSPQGVGTPRASGRVDRVLLMSIDEGTKYTGLHERQLGSIENDQQLFAFLRRKYYEHKAMPPFFTVRSVALSFSEFLVDIAHFAEVRLHKTCLGTSCTCLPPIERVVDDDEYQCSPAPERPLGYAPPYSSKLLTHYFQNPQCVPDSKRDIFLQLPKRVGPLPLSGDRRVPGWGIHFEEDWHQPTLFLLIWVFFVVGGLAFGIAWSVSKGDVSSAFAVTASWMAIAPILFGFVMARSSARGR